ncbi:T3JAM protein, partial [Pachyramphus minor]|nr:T3JAM protein [Pachyramphus minor]
GESYEEKCERRHETRENLWRRNNVTTCRHLPRGAEQPPQSPRQREFLRRRNLASDVGRAAPRQEPEVQTLPDSSLQVPPVPGAQLSLLCLAPTKTAGSKSQCSQNMRFLQTKTRVSSHPAESGAGTHGHPSECSSPLPSPQEALHRELLLKQKMVILQELFSTLLEASEKSWQGQLNEDKLKCKLRALENQLQACTQSYSKECVKKILIEMEDQKQTYEQKAKEALQKMLEDKLQTEQQLQNSQRSLAATREDLAFWKEHDTALKAELTKVTTAHTELKNSFHSLQSELQRAEAQNEELHRALRSLQSEHAALHLRATALRQDNDLKAQHITAIEDKLQKEQKQKVMLEATVSHLHNLIQNNQQKSQEVAVQSKDQVFTTQAPPLTPAKENQNTLLEHPEEEEEEEEEEEGEESLKDEVRKRTSQLTAKENECWELRSELEALSEEYQSCLTRLRQCRDELNRSHSQQAKRCHWIPLLVALTAVAIATFLASYRP